MSDTSSEASAPAVDGGGRELIGGDQASLREAGEELQRKREAGELAPAGEPEPQGPTPTKLTDGADTPLSARQAGRLLGRLRAEEAARSAAYQAAADAAVRAVDQQVAGMGAAEQERAAAFKQAAAELAASFRDITTAEDVRRLQEQDPGRYARYAHLDAQVRSGVSELQAGQQLDPDLDLQQRHAALESERQQLAAEKAAAEEARFVTHTAHALEVTLHGLKNDFAQMFGDVRTPQDLQALAQADPRRFALYQETLKNIATGEHHVRAVAQQEHESKKAAYERDRAVNDQYWELLHPELRDPAKAAEVGGAVARVFASVGLGRDDLEPLFDGRATIALSDWRTQEIIHKAAQYELLQERMAAAQASARNGKIATLPPVQRPGMAQHSDGKHDRIDALVRRSKNSTGMAQLRIEAEIAALRQSGRS